jgi:hypothetical protein
MIEEIRDENNMLLAILGSVYKFEKGRHFVGGPEEFIQVGCFNYDKDVHLKKHWHRIRSGGGPRKTQEVMICFSGSFAAHIMDGKYEIVRTVTLKPGDFIILYRGGHGFDILENDTIILEAKNGPFTTVEDDKVFI